MQGIDSRRYLGNSDENTMHTREWVYPIAGLLITCVALSIVSVGIKNQQYQPSNKILRLR